MVGKYHNSNARPKYNKYIIEKNNVCNWTNNDIKILIFSYLNNYYVNYVLLYYVYYWFLNLIFNDSVCSLVYFN